MKEFIVRMDEQMAREQPTKQTMLHNFIYSIYSINPRRAWSSSVSAPGSSLWSSSISALDSSLDHSSATKLVLSFRCQISGFSTAYKGIVMVELGQRGSGGHCMILVMRYLLASRVENEATNDLRSSLLGSDSISGLYKVRSQSPVRFRAGT